jgi:hypothetical protein
MGKTLQDVLRGKESSEHPDDEMARAYYVVEDRHNLSKMAVDTALPGN